MSRVGVVIFGATGFTGRYAAIEMVRLARKHSLTWAVAGRSRSKLESLMREVADITGEDVSHVKIIVADVGDEESLKQMCSQAQVVANCTGPYRRYGEPVVKAAIECGTHHVDITGETQFIETMQLKYDGVASEAGVYVVSACGYDSVPNDMGVIFLQQNFGGTVNSIESYMSSSVPDQYRKEARQHGVIHFATWDSLVHGLAHANELKPLRKQLFSQKLPDFEPKLLPRSVLHKKANSSEYCVPFMGADNAVVYRSQRRLYETEQRRPAHFRAYFQLGGLFQSLAIIIGAVGFFLMTKVGFLRSLLLRHPRLLSAGLVSREGPSRDVMENTRFQVELHAVGWDVATDTNQPPNKRAVARVSGTNPGYGATVLALLYSAVTILEEKDRMPARGGVITTGVAFKDTSFIKRLNENGIKFEMIETSAI